jgi:hypothetical protein
MGFIRPSSVYGDINKTRFILQQVLAKMQTATLVQVVSCTNSGGDSAVGFADVLPLVNQIDGQGGSTPHSVVHNIPYFRVQGGANAIILDPAVGDIGICVFASRDISAVKTTKAQANPGSYRSFAFSDGLYLGGVLNGEPTQYIQFTNEGINIVSPTQITLSAPLISFNGEIVQAAGTGNNATFNENITVIGDVTASGTSLHTHVHSGVESGPNNTLGPV